MSNNEIPASEILKAQQRLSRVVLRARLLRENIIGQDLAKWEDQTNYKVKLNVLIDKKHSDKEPEIEFADREYPEFSLIVAALCIARPFFLKEDGIHYLDVLKLLKTLGGKELAVEHEGDWETIKAWFDMGSFTHKSSVQAVQKSGLRTDRDLSSSWIYGFLIHDDVNRQSLVEMDRFINDYYDISHRAACQVVAVEYLLRYIEYCFRNNEKFFPDTSCWDVEVKVPTKYKPPFKIEAYALDKPFTDADLKNMALGTIGPSCGITPIHKLLGLEEFP